MKKRTCPYGSTLRAKVIEIHQGVHLVQDQNHEGHVLAAGAQDPQAKEGDHGTLTFTQGGPTGGFWKFERDKERRCAYCGEPAQGNYSIHRDGFGIGPEVPLCNRCGGKRTPSCQDIWDRIEKP